MEQPAMSSDPMPGRKRVVQLVMTPGVQLEQLHKAISAILDETGCRGCGLGGVDLQILAGDPAFKNARAAGGVEAVVTRAGG
jgi:hypothetical protein